MAYTVNSLVILDAAAVDNAEVSASGTELENVHIRFGEDLRFINHENSTPSQLAQALRRLAHRIDVEATTPAKKLADIDQGVTDALHDMATGGGS